MPRTTSSILFAASILFVGRGIPLAADGQQTQPVHPKTHGVWMDAGLGPGSLHVSSDTLRGRTENGMDVIMDMGWAFGPRFRVGLGWDQWTSKWWNAAGAQDWAQNFSVLAYYYPFARHNCYLEVGAASTDYERVHVPPGGERADSTYFSGTAWGVTGAAGWDIRAFHSRIVSLRPVLSYSYGPPRSLRAPDGTFVATGWRHQVVSLDLAMVLAPERR